MKFIIETFKHCSIPLLLFFILLSRLFIYRGIDWYGALGGGLGQIFDMILAAILIIESSGKKKNTDRGGIYTSVVLLTTIFVGSIFVAFVNEGQGVYYSIKGLCDYKYVPILLFFYLNKKQIDNNTVIRTLTALLLIYLVIYLYSYSIYPDYRFGFVNEEKFILDFESRGVMRAYIPYEDLIAIFFFYVISNKMDNTGSRLLSLFFLLFLTLARGTRFIIAGTFLMGFFLYLKQAKNNIVKSILGLLIVTSAIYMYIQILGVPPFLENYIELLQRDQESGEENIRVLMTVHYLFNFDASWSEMLFGHGLAVNSPFSDIKNSLTQYGFYADDVGYVELYLYFGIVGILSLFYLLYNVVRTKVPRQFLFAKYYIYYIFITMLCGRYLLTNMALVVTMLYLIEHNRIVENKKVT